MNNPIGDMLSSLQHADSFFPTGATSTSNGLEALVDDCVVQDGKMLEDFIRGQFRWRWTPFERPFLIAAFRGQQDLQEVAALDHLIHAQSLAAEARQGSVRTGRALLRMHAAMGTPGASDYQRLLAAKLVRGHNPIIQGLVWGSIRRVRSEDRTNFCTYFLRDLSWCCNPTGYRRTPAESNYSYSAPQGC